MTSQTKTTLLGILGLAIVVGLIWWGTTQRTTEEVIKWGFIGPLSGDGTAWGFPERNAIDLAVKEINDAGGINSQKIEVIYEDGKCLGREGATAAQKLINVDQVSVLLVSCSQEVVTVAPVAEPQQVLVFTSYAMSSVISDAGDYVFRNSYTNRDIAKTAAQVLRPKHDMVGIISEQSEFAADLRDQFKVEFGNVGGEVVEENFANGSKDVRTQVTRLVQQNPTAIFVNPNAPATGLIILQQLQEQGYTGTLVGQFFGSSKEVQQALEAQGMIFFADPPLTSSPAKAEFLEKYKEKYGEDPGLEYPAGARYDAIQILRNATEAVGDSPAAIKDYLYTMKPYNGLLGTYSFDEKGDPVGIKPIVNQIKNGKAIIYEPTN